MPDLPDMIAILAAFNEEDILQPVLEHLALQNIGFYVLDNWSTDATGEIARSFAGRGLVGYERLPAQQARGGEFNLRALLERKMQLARELGDQARAAGRDRLWIMHYDADEIIESPWPNTTLRQGLERVADEGFNAIDLRVLLFVPTADGFARGMCPRRFFTHFSLIDKASPLRGVKTWLQNGQTVDLLTAAGHAAEFPGRRVFPIPFLNLHYPIRSTAHGLQKIFKDRRPRYAAEGLQRGWHGHYDFVQDSAHKFIFDQADPILRRYDEAPFKREHLAAFYAPRPETLQAQMQLLSAELEEARAAVATIRELQKHLRYRLADRANGMLQRTGLHGVLKRMMGGQTPTRPRPKGRG